MREVIYNRVSTTEQTENFSLATQERSCVEFCERQGIVVDRIFREEGASAKNAARPVLQEALNYCALYATSIDLFVAYKIDRLACPRMVCDHHTIRIALLRLGVGLRAV